MKRNILQTIILFIGMLLSSQTCFAQNWDYIVTSGEYYYGEGTATTREESINQALSSLLNMVSVHVSSDFFMEENDVNTNGQIDHKTYIVNCLKTYSQSTLTNTEGYEIEKKDRITAYRWIKKNELYKIYEQRIDKALDMVQTADNALSKRKIDMALQYYYWAYCLISSTQHPNSVKDDQGRVLVNRLPLLIREIMEDLDIRFEQRDGDYVDMLFYYQNQPVSKLEYTYSDGNAECDGRVTDGRSTLEMANGYTTDTYHIHVKYEYKNEARGDAEMQSVMEVAQRLSITQADFVVSSTNVSLAEQTNIAQPKHYDTKTAEVADDRPIENAVPMVDKPLSYQQTIERVINAIKTKRYESQNRCFTTEGLEMFRSLISYGYGRIVGAPDLKFYESQSGRVTARGLQMSFTFRNKSGRKQTFVEDVVFGFDKSGKIDNVAFGLGKVAEDDILYRYAPGWKAESRELLMEFMENYKTAYSLQRIDYIRDIFADDAVIIVGNVARRRGYTTWKNDKKVTHYGREVITYNRYSKDQYLKNLARTFALNEYINIRFSNCDIQWLEKFYNEDPKLNEELFAIQIAQEYNSSRYADKGYLFLMIDMTDHENPQIKIRTWQPKKDPKFGLYSAGDFFND